MYNINYLFEFFLNRFSNISLKKAFSAYLHQENIMFNFE